MAGRVFWFELSGAFDETVVPRAAPTPALPQRGRESIGKVLFCSLAPLGRGLGRGARVRKRWWCAMPPPRPSPEGEGVNRRGLFCSLAPLGRGLGRGARVRKRWCRAMPPPRPSPRVGGSQSGRLVLLPRPSGERAGERGTREATVVPRDAPTPALPQSGRESIGEACFAPSPLWGEGWGEGHA